MRSEWPEIHLGLRPLQIHKVSQSERLDASVETKWRGRKPPLSFMDQIDIMIKTCEFYEAESDRLLAKLAKTKNSKQASVVISQLDSLKKKIAYEILQIEKIIEENEDL